MTRKSMFDALRQFAPGGKLAAADVSLIDELADRWKLPRENAMEISTKGLDLIKQAEGLSLKAYRDTGGVLTIGWGHTGPDVTAGMVITEAQADQLLREDVRDAEADVRRLFPITTQNQFDALVSFTFNLGADQVRESTLRRLHNEGDYAGAKSQFGRWVFDNGVKLAGLVRRRAAEAALYGASA